MRQTINNPLSYILESSSKHGIMKPTREAKLEECVLMHLDSISILFSSNTTT